MKIQPYYIAPLLIEQPTWGGSYIAGFKNIHQPAVASKKIGQAYELAAETMLHEHKSLHSFLFAQATSINQSEQFEPAKLFSLQELISSNPESVLGSEVTRRFGATMPLLIKFTQAQSNSYQVHFKQGEEFSTWLPKPESWYFMEDGKATLGLKNPAEVEKYKLRCQDIYTKAKEISQQIKTNQLTLLEGEQQLAAFIDQDHPSNYVNTIFPKAGQVIDLSQGGTHHSWETATNLPDGNIVYEVQIDVKDDYCTLRSFDQGKFKDDGSIRTLTIEEYFQALDLRTEANTPELFLQDVTTWQDDSTVVTTLFDAKNYKLTQLRLSQPYQGQETNCQTGFHHLFVESGELLVTTETDSYPLSKGWSLFIPAGVQSYQLEPSKPGQEVSVLKTTC